MGSSRLGGRDHGPGGVQGRHQPGVALQHHLDGLLVEEDAVLDRAHPVAQGRLDAAGPLGVSHHVDACRGGLGRHLGDLVVAEVRVARVVARAQHTTGGRHLDHVGAGPDELADPLAHLVRPVHEPAGPTRVGDEEGGVGPADAPVVAVPAGLAEHDDRDLHARARDHPALDRLLDALVGAAGVAHAGDADVQRLLEVRRRLVELQAERRLDEPHLARRVHHDVHVAVEEPGREVPAGAVDRLVPVEPGPHVDDPAVLDDDVGLGRPPGRPVVHRAAAKEGPSHACEANRTQARGGRRHARGSLTAPAASTILLSVQMFTESQDSLSGQGGR